MAKKIQDLRETLFETIELVKNGKIDVEKATAIKDIAQVIINSAKAEVDFLKHVNATGGTGFIGQSETKQLK